MLPDRERWLGAAVMALISHQILIFIRQGHSANPAVKLLPQDAKTRRTR
jgi:hypothetical protein